MNYGEIKFRGKSVKENKFVFGSLLKLADKTFIIPIDEKKCR